MSTPIVTFRAADFTDRHRSINWDALLLYLEISLPLLAVTIAFWYLFYRREDKKAERAKDGED